MTQPPIKAAFGNPQSYERFMGRWSAKIAPLFLDFAAIVDGERVLDVGCGTGNLALAILARAPRAQVVGIDPSSAYVEFARARAAGLAVEFEVGQADALTFPDASFDHALCQLALNFVPDSTAALREMRRVTRPRGVIAALVWDLSGGMRMLDAFWEAAGPNTALAARFGERATPYSKEEIGALWNGAGLREVTTADISMQIEFTSFDDYWSPFLLGQGPAGAYAIALTPAEQTELAGRLRMLVLDSREDGPISLPARAFAVRGTVPNAV